MWNGHIMEQDVFKENFFIFEDITNTVVIVHI